MPTYAFACPSCETSFDEKRAFAQATDPAICPSCATEAERIFSAVAFFRPGEAARTLLNGGGAKTTGAANALKPTHGAGCPCCRGH